MRLFSGVSGFVKVATMMSRYQKVTLVYVLILMYAGQAARVDAVTTSGTTNSSGSFTQPANWNNGVPGSEDNALFSRGGTAFYEVIFPGGSILDPPPLYLLNTLRVRSNRVTFVDNSTPFITTPSLSVANPDLSIIIGEDTGEEAILSTNLNYLSGANASIGHAPSAHGTLNVTAGTFNIGDTLDIGYEGAGTLNVTGGGRVFSTIGYISRISTSYGTATVAGWGSSWNTSNLVVGHGGGGILSIETGGTVTSSSSRIESNFLTTGFTTGEVIVTGTGSTWTNSGGLTISGGKLTIKNGGNVSSMNSLASGNITVDGAGSTWSIDKKLSAGVLNVTGGGIVSSDVGYVGFYSVGYHWTGYVTIDGVGSNWTVSGDLRIGDGGGVPVNPDIPDRLIVSSGGAVSVGGVIFVESFGTVSGNSTLSATTLDNRGVISPGIPFDPFDITRSSGILEIDGNYIQSAAGKLWVHLGGTTPGTNHDQLQVSGAVALSGRLQVDKVTSFEPSAGDAFDILDWGTLSGTFSTIQLPMLAAGLVWDTSRLYTTGVLRVIGNLPGDYNRNSVVDAADYIVWRNSLSQSGSGLAADGNGNNQIDTGDYDVWRTHFGQIVGSGAGSDNFTNSAVPEPASIVLLLLGFAGLSSVARSRRPGSDPRRAA
jgi:T5SS/PEP-CTERM-associated repeat protein